MTQLLDEAIGCVRQLPDDIQDKIARALIFQLQEEPEFSDGVYDAPAERRRFQSTCGAQHRFG
jgi:hypothetical protein